MDEKANQMPSGWNDCGLRFAFAANWRRRRNDGPAGGSNDDSRGWSQDTLCRRGAGVVRSDGDFTGVCERHRQFPSGRLTQLDRSL